MNRRLLSLLVMLAALYLSGCTTTGQKPYDYTAFNQSKPRSILVLPPVNNSPDVSATYGVYPWVTFPLAESGYYVIPVSLVDETLKANGVTVANEAHDISLDKLREIFGADAVLYLTIEQYGASYQVVSSDLTVWIKARLVDSKTGTLLWEGSASANASEYRRIRGGNLISMLVTAAIEQLTFTESDNIKVATMASERLLSSRKTNGILYGPRATELKP